MSFDIGRQPEIQASGLESEARSRLNLEAAKLIAYLLMQALWSELEAMLPAATKALKVAERAVVAGEKLIELSKIAVTEAKAAVDADDRLEAELKAIKTPPMQRATGPGTKPWTPTYPDDFQMPAGTKARAMLDLTLANAHKALDRARVDLQRDNNRVATAVKGGRRIENYLRFIDAQERPAAPTWERFLAAVGDE